MTEHEHDPELDPVELPDALAALLGDDDVWADAVGDTSDAGGSRSGDEAIVAAIMAEVGDDPIQATADPATVRSAAQTASDNKAPDNGVVSIDRARSKRWALPALLGAAAGVLLILGVLGIAGLGDRGDRFDTPDAEFALAATELAPDASASLGVTETPAGTLLVLDVDDLAPAPPGTYYEAWLRIDAEIGVSAGTFHLREGDEQIQLWAGVSPDDYPLFTITLQPEAQTESSGQVVLRARLEGG